VGNALVKIMPKLIFRPRLAAANKEEKSKINLPTPSHTLFKGKTLCQRKLLNSTQVAALECIIKSSLVGGFWFLSFGNNNTLK